MHKEWDELKKLNGRIQAFLDAAKTAAAQADTEAAQEEMDAALRLYAVRRALVARLAGLSVPPGQRQPNA